MQGKIATDFLGIPKIQKFCLKEKGEMTNRAYRKRGFSGGKRFFEKLVKEAVGLLPRELRLRLENVAFIVEDESPPRPEEWEDDGQELLGLYHGISQRDRGFWYGNVLPDRIIIYRRPLERISASFQELRENVRLTVFHEVGHYFGFDEEELQRFEKGDF
jgi:predicted Zn-dependent protease with MMP-like domain